MKKKLKDITIGEFVSTCNKSEKCNDCPFKDFRKCRWVVEAIDYYKDLEKEYEIH